ncbi:MAG: VCBS repeat-containing protein, partial [Candidatus Marinimicrobia bacterium]|nr:VCBS repeat-containing protein [Candidatus Neomarinimicrobiota bacterium]
PMSVYAADLDSDGDMDLAVSCYDSDIISLLYNQGDGTFPNRIDYNLSLAPRSCKAADLDNDGDLDLVVVTDQTVIVLLNQSSIADLALSVDTLAFSPIQIGQTDTLDLTIYNQGLDSTLLVSEIKQSSSSSVFSMNPVSFSVPPGDSVTVAVIFAPANWAASFFDSMTILTNDPHKPIVFAYLLGDAATLAIRNLMGVPGAFALHGNYPNPFNPSTTLQFDLPMAT